MSFEPWLVLRLDLLPSIAQEVEQISSDYIYLSEEVRKGNKQAYQDLIVLQAKVRGRIDEFDRFYDRNYADYRIGYFEKMKLRLRKLISPHIDVNRLIFEETQNFNQPPPLPARQSPQKLQIPQIPPQEAPPKRMASPPKQLNKPKTAPIKPKPKPKYTAPSAMKEISKPKAQDELVFTIKMSKEEYLQYIQTKQQKR